MNRDSLHETPNSMFYGKHTKDIVPLSSAGIAQSA